MLKVGNRAEVAIAAFYWSDMRNNILRLRTNLCIYLNVEKCLFLPFTKSLIIFRNTDDGFLRLRKEFYLVKHFFNVPGIATRRK